MESLKAELSSLINSESSLYRVRTFFTWFRYTLTLDPWQCLPMEKHGILDDIRNGGIAERSGRLVEA